MLTPTQWSLLQPLLPPPSQHLRGRPPLDDRLIFEAIIYKICHDLPWYDLPAEFPSHQTVYRRYRQWRRLGLWRTLLQALFLDLLSRGEFDLKDAFDQGIYRLHIGLNRCTVLLDPAAPLTWQVLTGWFFASLVGRYAFRIAREPRLASHIDIFDLPI